MANRCTVEKALTALADPAVCVLRLWEQNGVTMDKTTKDAAKKIGAAFKAYLQKEHCRLALGAWMDARYKQPKDMTQKELQKELRLAVLRYCAEGNLLAVLREWFALETFSPEDVSAICEILTRKGDKGRADFNVYVHVQTKDDYKDRTKTSICCSCGFAEQLTMDHHDVGTATGKAAKAAHKNIQKAFNSPFRPMALFVGRGAQEGFDFHKYCLRIMHLTLPRGAVSFDQRQGRIDRYHSLLVRRRACEVLGITVSPRLDLDAAVFQRLEAWKESDQCPDVWKKDQIFPHWQIKEFGENDLYYQSRHHFERVISALRYTHEEQEYKRARRQLNSYRASIGSSDIPIPEQHRDLVIHLATKLEED